MGAKKRSKSYLDNLYRKGVGTGRPPKFPKPIDLRNKINEFFNVCVNEGQPPTISGLTLFCGFCDRQSFYDYEKDKSEFSCITRGARTFIANWHEIRVATSDRPQGSIFMLKNFGFSDTQTVEHKGDAMVQQSFKIEGQEITF